MSVYRRKGSAAYYVDLRWQGYPRVQVSTGTTNKARANAMVATVRRLRDMGRRDVIGLIASGKLRLEDVHDDLLVGRDVLEQRIAQTSSPALANLVDEWLEYLASPAALSVKTKRPYSPKTVRRYWESWQRLFAGFPKGRETTLGDITKGLLADYRKTRIGEGRTGATINRDMVALQSFMRWLSNAHELAVPSLEVPRQRESLGRERWLEPGEIERLKAELPEEWWPLFATLVFTGLRVSEAQGLSWADVRLADRVIWVRAGSAAQGTAGKRRLKTELSDRNVPIAEPLAIELAALAATSASGPSDPVFPGHRGDYHSAYRVFKRACKTAKLDDVTIHDLRHTFAVHWLLGGSPLVRLQKILGHATAAMTMRYMRHAPDGFFAEDAAKVAASLSGDQSREASARAELARESLRLA
jgi:integrase